MYKHGDEFFIIQVSVKNRRMGNFAGRILRPIFVLSNSRKEITDYKNQIYPT